MLLRLNDIKQLNKDGLLVSAHIHNYYTHDKSEIYTIAFKLQNGQYAHLVTHRNSLIIKEYKSLTAASRVVRSAGFLDYTVEHHCSDSTYSSF